MQLYISGSCRYSESLVSASFLKQKALILFLYCVLYSCTHDPSGSELLDTSGCFQNKCPVDPSGHFIPAHTFSIPFKSRDVILFWSVAIFSFIFFLCHLSLVCVENGTGKDDISQTKLKV